MPKAVGKKDHVIPHLFCRGAGSACRVYTESRARREGGILKVLRGPLSVNFIRRSRSTPGRPSGEAVPPKVQFHLSERLCRCFPYRWKFVLYSPDIWQKYLRHIHLLPIRHHSARTWQVCQSSPVHVLHVHNRRRNKDVLTSTCMNPTNILQLKPLIRDMVQYMMLSGLSDPVASQRPHLLYQSLQLKYQSPLWILF